jgi:creatinine amidohydrolase
MAGVSAAGSTTPGWVAGLAILRERHAEVARRVRDALADPRDEPSLAGARAVVTTGVGSSLAHARYLAWLLRTRCDIPSWDVPTGAFLEPPSRRARDHALVVFSQGLSPNARPPLGHAFAYGTTLLVSAAEQDDAERAAALRAARDAGVVVVPVGCRPEYGVLLRLVGPMLGYVAALRLANAAGAGVEVSASAIGDAIDAAVARMEHAIAGTDAGVFAEPITFVATGGYAGLAHNLQAKVQEGMFLPFPGAVDALELAHGSLQEASGKPRTFVALARGAPFEASLFARARRTLEPQHRWLELDATLPGPLAVLEHEAMTNALVLAAVEARQLDQRDWPAKGRDGPLYEVAAADDLVPSSAR